MAEIGQFHTLYMQLRLNPDKSFEYYRMSIQSFDVLLNLTKDYITKQNTKLRTAIPPEERLTVTLRYLSTGMNFKINKVINSPSSRCFVSISLSQLSYNIFAISSHARFFAVLSGFSLESQRQTLFCTSIINRSVSNILCVRRHCELSAECGAMHKNTCKASTERLCCVINYFKMKPIEIIAIWKALEQDRKRKRRYWVHPLNTKRISSGQFHCLYATLREYPSKFIQFYRMSVESFDELLTIVKCFITKNDTKFRCAITPEERLTITLRAPSTQWPVMGHALQCTIVDHDHLVFTQWRMAHCCLANHLRWTSKSVYRHKVIKKKWRKRRWWMLTIHRNRTRVFKRPIPLDVVKTSIITHSCLLLHNFLRKSKSSRNIYTPPGSTDSYDRNGELIRVGMRVNHEENLLPLQSVPRRPPINATQIRSNFMNYIHQSRLCSGLLDSVLVEVDGSALLEVDGASKLFSTAASDTEHGIMV
ncbi:hypothetical protein HW555_012947, partial [Spodoptera exigua]